MAADFPNENPKSLRSAHDARVFMFDARSF